MSAALRASFDSTGRNASIALCAALAGVSLSASPARCSARPGAPFRVVARSQDELGVWHVTALLPQQGIVNGKATIVSGSMLARVDCRQRVLRIDAWSLQAPTGSGGEGWRAPATAAETDLFETVCNGAPQLRGPQRGETPFPPKFTGPPETGPAGPRSAVNPPADRRSHTQFAAQIGLFSSTAAAQQALEQARSALPQPQRFSARATALPGSAKAFRALLLAPSLLAAREVCQAERQRTAASTCWVHRSGD